MIEKPDPVVRTAMPSDEDEIMAMCRMLHEENGLFRMSEERVRVVIRQALDRKGGLLGVIGQPGKIEAMIYMLLCQIWHSDDWHLEEIFNYVRPEYRKSNNAKALIQFAKKCALELDMDLVIGVVSNTRTEEKIRLYQRQLGKPNGAFFVFNSKWDSAA